MLPLEGLRFIELGLGPVTGLATMMLADFGAEVIKIEPPGGDPNQAMPSSRMWSRGKSILEVDLGDDAEVAKLRQLICDSGDAVVTTLSKDERELKRLDYTSLSRNRPDLIYGSVAGFGESGAYARYPADEPVIAAKFGRMMSFEGSAGHAGPNYAALQVATHATAQSVATALLAACHARAQTGKGFEFDTSMLRGMLPYDLAGLQTEQLVQKGLIERPAVRQDPRAVLPRIYYHAARTRDGRWLQFGNLLPHLEANFYRAAGIKVPEGGVPKSGPALEQFRDQLLEHIQTRNLAEWMEIFVADGGVVAHPYQTTQEALTDPDLTANGHVAEVTGGLQLGVVAQLSETPGQAGDAACHTSFAQLATGQLQVPPRTAADPQRPLDGVTVVEAATIIAAPLGAATLADLGARVIKLEPLSGDPFRSMMHGIGAAKCNTGKESICLDLKSAAGKAIATQLIEQADIFIHNYRPGVPEKLGLGYDDLAQHNPELIYISANGYGPAGPGAKRPSTHPIPGAALGGVVWQMGGLPQDQPLTLTEIREITRRLFRANEVNPDPNTSMVVATTATLGLLARDMTGKGQKIFIDMFGANAYANWDDFLSFDGKPERPAVDTEQYGLGPRHRLYECASGWVFLKISTDEQWALLGVADVDELEARFKTDAADAWEEKLTALGIACVRADTGWPAEFLLNDPFAREQELVVPAVHGEWGEYLRHGPMVRFAHHANYPGASLPGDATVSLLEEIGYDRSAIAQLLESSVVRQYEKL
jgi:crotonobetainyl-CoA:carnitine CoA-transferase CaiB-like acyl-CoA transferase